YRNKPTPCTPRNAVEDRHSRRLVWRAWARRRLAPFRRLCRFTRSLLLSGLDWLLQILARRTMNQKHTRSAASLALANQSAIEPHVVMASDSNAEYRRLTVDGNASCA